MFWFLIGLIVVSGIIATYISLYIILNIALQHLTFLFIIIIFHIFWALAKQVITIFLHFVFVYCCLMECSSIKIPTHHIPWIQHYALLYIYKACKNKITIKGWAKNERKVVCNITQNCFEWNGIAAFCLQTLWYYNRYQAATARVISSWIIMLWSWYLWAQ